METTRTRLSTLWVFVTLNYVYCDVVGLMDPALLKKFLSGNLGTFSVTQGFLLGGSILVEIPIAMVLLSRFLGLRSNRYANIVAGSVMTAVQLGSLFISRPTPYYIFFSAIEITGTSAIVWYAWTRFRSHATGEARSKDSDFGAASARLSAEG